MGAASSEESRGGALRLPASTAGSSEFGYGFYFIDYRPEHIERQLENLSVGLSSPPRYILFYRDLDRGFWTSLCRMIRDRGAVPVVSLELWRWGPRTGNHLPEIAAGQWDGQFRAWARGARDFGSPVLLRFGFEMNGDWFSWGGQPEMFIQAWRRVHGIFQEEGATNVEWVFSPNCVSVPNKPENAIPKYWPGDEYVDWLGVDGYNFGDHHDEWHRWQSFHDIFDPVLDLYAKERPELPVLIAEFGCAPGRPGQKVDWIRDAGRLLEQRPQVIGAIWFNFDKRREGEPNWTLTSEPGGLEAFDQGFARRSAAP